MQNKGKFKFGMKDRNTIRVNSGS